MSFDIPKLRKLAGEIKQMTSDEQVIKEFDEKFGLEPIGVRFDGNSYLSRDDIKSFIIQKLKEARKQGFDRAIHDFKIANPTVVEQVRTGERQRIRQAVEGMKRKFKTPDFGPHGPDDGAIEAMNTEQADIGAWNAALDEVLSLLDKPPGRDSD